LLGVLVVATLSLGAFALTSLNSWSSDSMQVVVGFPDVGGVKPGTRVRIQGMDAGEIEDVIAPQQPGDRVMLRLRIAGKYRQLIREDAKVQLASENLFAGKIVRIVPGAASAKLLDDHGELKADIQPDALEGIAEAAGKLNKLLVEVDSAMQSFRRNDGSVTEDLINATKKLNTVLAKADKALDGVEKGEGSLGKLIKDDKLYTELTETVAEVKSAMKDVKNGEGTLGKLVKSNEAYAEAVASLQDVRRMVKSVQQNSDAIKALPVVRSYVIDYNKELIRPDCKRFRIFYSEKDLFEPGKAVLTATGKKKLAEGADWLNKQKHAGAEVLVVAFAEPNQKPEFAQTVTQKQSEVVLEFLRNQHQVHRTGWWWWSTRPTRAIGCGTTPTPVPETETLPAARIELIVFAPPE
jgi:phospholipid/cholesterol/gamma-HCH transport system substrate-binding protein